jgi:titin
MHSSSQINLAWTDASANETGFRIERSTNGTSFTQIATTGANTATYSNTGLTGATLYYYRVRATNTAGDSAFSNTASATTLVSIPAAPKALTITASSQINLAWTDASTNETGFRIERSTDGTSFTQLTTTGANTTTYTNSGLTEGTLYYYRVRATNTAGNSAYSNTVSATTTISIPPPSDLTAAVTSNGIVLTWLDKTSNESGFYIERASGTTSFTRIATVGANATSFTNSSVVIGVTYRYRVQAYTSVAASVYSNIVSVTP